MFKKVILIMIILMISCDDTSNNIECRNNEVCATEYCNLKINRCEKNPCMNNKECQNNGECIINSEHFPECICNYGYTNNPNNPLECIPDSCNEDCGGNGICDNSSGSPVCICNDGYLNDLNNPLLCVPESCNEDCGGNGVCDNSSGSPVCMCNEGYQDNDRDLICKISCSNEIINECGENGRCFDNTGEIYCKCKDGYNLAAEQNKCSESAYLWTKIIGSSGYDESYFVKTDSNNNIYITGTFGGRLDFNPESEIDNHTSNGGYDIFLIKFDSEGNYIWTKTMGGLGDDFGRLIAFDRNNNLYLAGGFGAGVENESMDFNPGSDTDTHSSNGDVDIFISKFDSEGNYLWTGTIGGINTDYIRDIKIDENDNIYLLGGLNGKADLDPGSSVHEYTSKGYSDSFITKLNNNGNYVWTKIIGNVNNDGASCDLRTISIDSENNLYLSGNFTGSCYLDPNSTNVYTSDGYANFIITKLDSDGNSIWIKTMGSGVNNNILNNSATDSENNLYITGSFQNEIDFDPSSAIDIHNGNSGSIFITKFNTNGDYLWTKTMKGEINPEDQVYGIASAQEIDIDSDDNLYITGYFKNTIDFDPSLNTDNHTATSFYDTFISKLNSNGNYKWTKTIKGIKYGPATRYFDIDTNNNLYLTGTFDIEVDFDPSLNTDLHTSRGNTDIFIWKYGN